MIPIPKVLNRTLAMFGIFLATVPVLARLPELPLAIEDALAVSELGQPITFSPDGQWLAYSVGDSRRRPTPNEMITSSYLKGGFFITWIGYSVWITNAKSGVAIKLSDDRANAWGPVWSPNGKMLAFYSDQSGKTAVWIWERDTKTSRELKSIRPLFAYNLVQWTPDSRRILVRALPEGMSFDTAAKLQAGTLKLATAPGTKPTVSVRTSQAYSKGQTDSKRRYPGEAQPDVSDSTVRTNFTRLVLVDAFNGRVENLVQDIFPQSYWVSPSGSEIAFANWKGLERNTQRPLYDLNVVSSSGGPTRTLAANVPLEFEAVSVSWSPDGKLLSYITSPRSNGDCFVVQVKGGAPFNVTPGPHPNFGFDYRQRTPLWDATGNSIFLLSDEALWQASVEDRVAGEVATIPNHQLTGVVAPGTGGRLPRFGDRKLLYLAARDKDTLWVGFYQVDLETHHVSALFEENKKYGETARSVDITADGNTIAYVAQDAQHSEDIWIADSDLRQRRKLTHLNPQLDKYQMGESRLIDWTSTEGEKLKGALLLPANYQQGKRYPLIVIVYEGPLSNQVNRFGLRNVSGPDNMQLLATRGYAVFLPDAHTRVGTPMRDLASSILPGIDKLIEAGVVDSDRIGLIGQSYGGYVAMALLVQTTRFKAAVMRAGFANLVSYYGVDKAGSTAYLEVGQGKMGGTPWQYRDRYIENSPVFFLDRVQTPLLIIHGTADPTVPLSATDEVFVDLRRLGKEVVYAKYEGEGHWEGLWSRANQVDYMTRMIAWFDAHLKRAD